MAGIALAVIVALASTFAATFVGTQLLGMSGAPISPIMLAIVAGMAIANLAPLPESLRSGFAFCTQWVLRAGIVLLGFRLSLNAAGAIGLNALPLIVACIATALAVVLIAGRLMRLPWRLNGLIAMGTSICGCTAIVAVAPLIRARDAEISYAIATITIFGLVAMLAYPWLAHWLFAGSAEQAGYFLGTAVHETAQVAGAGLIYQQQFGAPAALDVATVTKLVRNLTMVILVPVIALLFRDPEAEQGSRWYQLIPGFIVGFAALCALRTLGDWQIDNAGSALGLFSAANWSEATAAVGKAAKWLLTVAMAAVGLTTRFAVLKDLGLRPFLLGLAAATAVGVTSAMLLKLF